MRKWGLPGCVIVGVVLGACHLADDVELPPCPEGTYRENRVCKEDPNFPRPTVEIAPAAGGTQCNVEESMQRSPALNPSTLEVKAAEYFRFDNKDVIDHEVKGIDGQSWVTVKAGQRSNDMNITKVGSWPYRVSGCAKGGGTIVVK